MSVVLRWLAFPLGSLASHPRRVMSGRGRRGGRVSPSRRRAVRAMANPSLAFPVSSWPSWLRDRLACCAHDRRCPGGRAGAGSRASAGRRSSAGPRAGAGPAAAAGGSRGRYQASRAVVGRRRQGSAATRHPDDHRRSRRLLSRWQGGLPAARRHPAGRRRGLHRPAAEPARGRSGALGRQAGSRGRRGDVARGAGVRRPRGWPSATRSSTE